jgi:phospholipase/lecithinase/hemolysin
MKSLRNALAGLLLTFGLAASAHATSFSQIIVLGDSLSDNGNLFAATGYPPPPYWQGRASNGPVAVEYLAQSLGVPLRDFAWYGATTGVGNYADGGTVDALGTFSLPGMMTAFQGALSAGLFPIDPNALYIVWGGPNDFWNVTSGAEATTAIGKAVANLVTIVGTLQSLGAEQILVPGMPDLGRTPYLLSLGEPYSGFFTQISMGFDQTLQASLPPGAQYFDTFSFVSGILDNPSMYGFENITDPCFTGSSVCANPDKYFFFDSVHPTTAGHELVGNGLRESVVPEPSSLTLLSFGIIGLITWRRAYRNR